MGKWFGNIITTLVILALTSIAAGLLKGPIDDIAAANRIQAQVQMAPWIPRIDLSELDAVEEGDSERYDEIFNDLEDQFRNIEARHGDEADDFNFLRINLENSSPKTVENVNFRVESYLRNDAIYIDSEGTARPLGDVERIELPDMAPGDRLTVYMWGHFSPYLTPTRFKSYSSEGAFRVSFDWAESKDFEYQSGVARFFDEWAETVAFSAGLLAFLGLTVSAAVSSEYYKNLLKNPEAYQKEHERFTEDEKNFQPDWAGVQTAASHLESVKKGLLPKGKNKEKVDEEQPPTPTNGTE